MQTTNVPERVAAGVAAARRHARGAWPRLRASWARIAQASGAACAAWLVTHDLLGHPAPFFAPIAAIVSLTAAAGQRGRLALQMLTGVLVGIGIAEAVVRLTGTGAAQLLVAVGLAMAAGFLLGTSGMIVNQAAASAVLVVALHRSGAGSERLLDAAIGGGVALATSELLFPTSPVTLLRNAEQATLLGLADALERCAKLLSEDSDERFAWTLRTAAETHAALAALATARSLAPRMARQAPTRRRWRSQVARSAAEATVVDLLGNAVITLIRGAVRRSEEAPVPDWVDAALRHLGAATRAAAAALGCDGADARDEALAAVARVAQHADAPDPVWASLGAAVRVVASDLIRVTGIERDAARSAVANAHRAANADAAASTVR